MHDCVLDMYHVSPESFDGHYEHKEDHKCIEDSLETLHVVFKYTLWHLRFMKATSYCWQLDLQTLE